MEIWEKLFEIIDSPENDGKDYSPVIHAILESLTDDQIIKLFMIAEKKGLEHILPYIIKEIERRHKDIPPNKKN